MCDHCGLLFLQEMSAHMMSMNLTGATPALNPAWREILCDARVHRFQGHPMWVESVWLPHLSKEAPLSGYLLSKGLQSLHWALSPWCPVLEPMRPPCLEQGPQALKGRQCGLCHLYGISESEGRFSWALKSTIHPAILLAKVTLFPEQSVEASFR